MKRSYFSYLLFVIAMSAFVMLRVHAGRAQENQPAKPAQESGQTEDKAQTLADMQQKMEEEKSICLDSDSLFL